VSGAEILCIVMFAGTIAALMSGFPVAFALAGSALLFFGIGLISGHLTLAFLTALPPRIYGIMTNDVLIAIPLFIFMGVMLERSGVAENLLETCAKLFGGIRGGLVISVSLVGALLAATTGVVGADVVAMGLIALPTMLRHKYSPALAAGSIAAAGTLAQIIPPSVVLVVLGDQLGTAYQTAQLGKGNFAPESITVADLFAGAVLPGLVLVALYVVYQALVAWIWPKSAPTLPKAERHLGPRPLVAVAEALLPVTLLMVAVLGAILGGIATPTEAAAVGAAGSVLLAARRLDRSRAKLVHAAGLALAVILALTALFDLRAGRDRVSLVDSAAMAVAAIAALVVLAGLAQALVRLWRAGLLKPAADTVIDITTMIFAILIGATLFSLVFRGLGGDEFVKAILSHMPGGTAGAVLIVMAVMFVLGFFLDFLEIVFIVVPIVAPALLAMEGIDPVWLGIMMAVNLQTSFMHPPLGAALFYLRSVAPPSVTTAQIYIGAVPFVIIELLCLVLLWFFPWLATALPKALYG
jgi:tripartite ATP-independent transporter DctM subunit